MEIRDACILVCVCMQIIYCGRLSGKGMRGIKSNNTDNSYQSSNKIFMQIKKKSLYDVHNYSGVFKFI